MRRSSLVLPLIGAALLAAPAAAETVRLAGNWDLEVSLDAQTAVATVALSQSGRFDQAVSIGNALEPQTPQTFIPCAACPQALLVVIDDASSTYGAQHGVVVWARGPAPWWALSPLPFDQFKLWTSSGGVSLIENTATHVRYAFRDGLLGKVR